MPPNRKHQDAESAPHTGGAQDWHEVDADRAELFLALHAANHSRLVAFVHTLVPAWQDAEEIIQDTVVVLWRKFDDFDPTTSFFSWAARVAQFEVLNYRRKQRSKRVQLLSEQTLEILAADAVSRMEDLDTHREALAACIQKLPDREQVLVRLRYQDGGDVHAVAGHLDRTTGHTQRVLNKIRATLRRCVQLRLTDIGA